MTFCALSGLHRSQFTQAQKMLITQFLHLIHHTFNLWSRPKFSEPKRTTNVKKYVWKEIEVWFYYIFWLLINCYIFLFNMCSVNSKNNDKEIWSVKIYIMPITYSFFRHTLINNIFTILLSIVFLSFLLIGCCFSYIYPPPPI